MPKQAFYFRKTRWLAKTSSEDGIALRPAAYGEEESTTETERAGAVGVDKIVIMITITITITTRPANKSHGHTSGTCNMRCCVGVLLPKINGFLKLLFNPQ